MEEERIPSSGMPVLLNKSNTVGGPRRDYGTGLCGTVVHFRKGPINSLSDAVALLDKPPSDREIRARKSAVYGNINFRNSDPGSSGDFTLPIYPDELLPFSADFSAMPPGDDDNIALRLRGYLNVINPFGSQTVTFGINCDDACSLKIGNKIIFPLAHFQVSARVTKQVTFLDPGLYPVEIVYYQNAGDAYLEWSRAPGEKPEGNQLLPLDAALYKPIPSIELHSSMIGQNPSCQECSGAACPSGTFCADGLCQSCNLPEHCGITCLPCPAGTHMCVAGKCM